MSGFRAFGFVVSAILAIFTIYTIRATWIHNKIAALSLDASSIYKEDNIAIGPKGADLRMVLIGDSRIVQWPETGLDADWKVINRGIAGETVAQLNRRFVRDAIELFPDVLLIASGINDLVAASFMDDAQKLRVANETADSLRNLATVAANAGSRVFLATVIPPGEPSLLRLPVWSESLRDQVEIINKILRQSRFPAGVILIDFSRMLGLDDRTLLPGFSLDTLHLNEAAYARLYSELVVSISHLGSVRPSKGQAHD